MELIKATDLAIGYEGKAIYHNLNFTINSGDYVCIYGSNGTGKSTLMKTILGLQKPIIGSIEYLNGLTKKEIGYLPQRTEIQKDFPATVNEVVMSGLQGKKGFGWYTKADREVAVFKMEKLGITRLKNKCFRELSGGQQQRVLLARALCATDKILLMDEPVTGLDFSVVSEMYNLSKDLNESGIAIIMISHDAEISSQFANKILDLNYDGFFGSCAEWKAL